tara:strand:- start:176 stop:373 length:198 start_codon:yes stop_codon:yes gene_type:complete
MFQVAILKARSPQLTSDFSFLLDSITNIPIRKSLVMILALDLTSGIGISKIHLGIQLDDSFSFFG